MNREDLKIISNRPAITHEQAAEVLFNCATLLQMAGANQYRIARYRMAALNMMRLGPAALEIALDEELWSKMDLGKRLGNKLRELVREGSMNFYVELKADLPPAVDSLMSVQGVGPKLALRLNKELGVNSPLELADAALSATEKSAKALELAREEQQHIRDDIQRRLQKAKAGGRRVKKVS